MQLGESQGVSILYTGAVELFSAVTIFSAIRYALQLPLERNTYFLLTREEPVNPDRMIGIWMQLGPTGYTQILPIACRENAIRGLPSLTVA